MKVTMRILYLAVLVYYSVRHNNIMSDTIIYVYYTLGMNH